MTRNNYNYLFSLATGPFWKSQKYTVGQLAENAGKKGLFSA
jgi:hypothetical protein